MNPFKPTTLRAIAQTHGTPIWVYDAATIRTRIAALRAFDTIRFAQKANSNTHILRLMRQEGVLVDAVSLGEIERALAAGYSDFKWMAQDPDLETLRKHPGYEEVRAKIKTTKPKVKPA